MTMIGMVSKGACRQLLIKCYLATGRFQEAKEQADILINESGYKLMENDFGTFINPHPDTWNITRNVIWDLHRPENKCIKANTEAILSMPNRAGTDAAIALKTMRNWVPFWNGDVKSPSNKKAVQNYAQQVNGSSNANYSPMYDYNKALGRGIGHIRPTYFATHSLWYVNGKDDKGDLRHNSEVGNWARMEDMKYNDRVIRNGMERIFVFMITMVISCVRIQSVVGMIGLIISFGWKLRNRIFLLIIIIRVVLLIGIVSVLQKHICYVPKPNFIWVILKVRLKM